MIDLYLAVGHGVEPNGVWDPGAVAADGTQEHTLATVVCTAAAAALTRSGVTFQWESNAGAGHDPDYRGSVNVVNALNPKIAVEVHFDANNAPRGGFGIYVSAAGQKLAYAIDGRFHEAGLPQRKSYQDVRGLYFLKGTHCPAVIYECDRTMAQPDINILNRMGEAIAQGICDYLGVTHNPPAPPVGGPVQPRYHVHMIGDPVADYTPPEGGSCVLTDMGFLYCFGPAVYHGAPGGDANAGWGPGSDRRGADIQAPNPKDPNKQGPHYVIIDTAGETYNY